MSVTFHVKNKKRNKKHGFFARMSSTAGKNILNARRRKGRTRLAVHAGR